MCNTHQSPLRFDLIQASQAEAAEVHIVFDLTEDRFDLDVALHSQRFALLGEQVGTCEFSEAS